MKKKRFSKRPGGYRQLNARTDRLCKEIDRADDPLWNRKSPAWDSAAVRRNRRPPELQFLSSFFGIR